MKIVVINGSHRIEGNSYRFARFVKGLLSCKHSVEVFDLNNSIIHTCTGCLCCEEGENCPLKDDDFTNKIVPVIKAADLLIFATPVYFNMPSALMTNYIDRTNELCDFFAKNKKKAMTYLVGQTDRDSIFEAYRCLRAYIEIMGMEEIAEPIIQIARGKNEAEFSSLKVILEKI